MICTMISPKDDLLWAFELTRVAATNIVGYDGYGTSLRSSVVRFRRVAVGTLRTIQSLSAIVQISPLSAYSALSEATHGYDVNSAREV